MSGIAGIVNFERTLGSELENIKNMAKSLSKRGESALKIKNSEYGIFGCTSFLHCQNQEKQIPFSLKAGGCEYTICFDGLLYNSNELKSELEITNSLLDNAKKIEEAEKIRRFLRAESELETLKKETI